MAIKKLPPATANNLQRLVYRFLEPGDAVLDIGAADGLFTRIYAERVGPNGAVWACEPHARSRALGQQYCPSWVTWIPRAVGPECGMTTLFFDRADPKRSSVFAANVVERDGSMPVPLITLDALVAQMPQSPAFIQMDAQGSEPAILRGATHMLALRSAVWVIEVWPAGLREAGSSTLALLEPFAALGYAPETMRGRALSWAAAARECEATDYCDLVMVPTDAHP